MSATCVELSRAHSSATDGGTAGVSALHGLTAGPSQASRMLLTAITIWCERGVTPGATTGVRAARQDVCASTAQGRCARCLRQHRHTHTHTCTRACAYKTGEHTRTRTHLVHRLVVLGHRLVAALPQEVAVHAALVAGSACQARDRARDAGVACEQDAALRRVLLCGCAYVWGAACACVHVAVRRLVCVQSVWGRARMRGSNARSTAPHSTHKHAPPQKTPPPPPTHTHHTCHARTHTHTPCPPWRQSPRGSRWPAGSSRRS
jgi:hypothetical protein